jgi:hypothetical protein
VAVKDSRDRDKKRGVLGDSLQKYFKWRINKMSYLKPDDRDIEAEALKNGVKIIDKLAWCKRVTMWRKDNILAYLMLAYSFIFAILFFITAKALVNVATLGG